MPLFTNTAGAKWSTTDSSRAVGAFFIPRSLLLQKIYSLLNLYTQTQDSVKHAAKIIAHDMLIYYHGNEPGDIPGNLAPPYYWWECGAMFGALIDYWYYTGDSTYNDLVIAGLLFQASPTRNFMPLNQTSSEGNDDQGFWAIAAMAAAERKFPDPPSTSPQWLTLALGVFNSQFARWDMETCAGGLKWQIFALNNGYDYKNTISNGCFFDLAARLALYTGNDTFAQWADKTWDWVKRNGLISEDWQVYDGVDDLLNCTKVNHEQWSYNAAIFLHGAAIMYNYVCVIESLQPTFLSLLCLTLQLIRRGTQQTNGDPKWTARVQGLLAGLHTFFIAETNIMHEVTCEATDNCLVDQRSFKAYLARFLAATAQLAPFTAPEIMTKLQASAIAAAKTCSGGKNGRMCGLKWTTGAWDGYDGVGEQMSALEVIQANLLKLKEGPYTLSTGATSTGDPSAGLDAGGKKPPLVDFRRITPADSAGVAVLTAGLVFGIVLGTYWVIEP
ncbi:hydrolase 76 protein [Ascosphaera aggregata]|nr:hydrolase 76 protein [Ascosphaera aggregata]